MSSEKRERLKQIRERHHQQPPSTAIVVEWKDIDFLLAQLDSQANLDFAIIKGEMVTVSDCPECRTRFPVFTVSSQLLCNDCRTATATAMRDKCVEKVNELIEQWADPDSDLGDEVSGFRIDAANDIIEELQSLTLDQVEEKQ